MRLASSEVIRSCTTLNVYTNSDTDGRDEWLIERAAQDGFKVQVVGAGAADTQNRLLAEKASPIADVVFGLNAIIWESLKAENTIILLTIMIQIEKRGHYMSVSKVKTTIVKQKIRNPILNVLAHVYAYLLFLIYVIPVALVVLFSFTDSATIASKHLTLSSFTLDNYISIFQKASSYKPFVVSIAYSAIAASFVAIIVLIACRILQKRKDRLGGALEYGLLIPWLLPTTLMALGLITTYNTPRVWMFNNVLTGTSVIMLIGYSIPAIITLP